MRIAACLVVCSGCCADTYEVGRDTSRQPLASLILGTETVSGPLLTFPVGSGFVTRLEGSTNYQLEIPSKVEGAYTVTLVARRGAKQLATYEVSVEARVTVEPVCLDPDQNDYGTGRCRDSYLGTLDVTGIGVSAVWQLDQRAVVVPGTPDC